MELGGGHTSLEERGPRVCMEDIPEGGLELNAEAGRELIEACIPKEDRFVFDLLEPVRAKLRLRRRGQEVQVQGQVTARLALQCDRCLAWVEQSVDAPIGLTFMPHPVMPEGAQIELSEKDLDVEFYGQDGVIDLGEVIVEELVLAVPYRLLCKEACQGICPGCGADLNREECRCEGKPPDPRLAALKNIKFE